MTRAQNDRNPIMLRREVKSVEPLRRAASTAAKARSCLSRGRRISIFSESISRPVKSTTVPSIDLLAFSVIPRKVHKRPKRVSSSPPKVRKSSR
jgi:hypothetical protein